MPGPKRKKGVIVAARQVKRERVDYPLEMLACLDAPLTFGNLTVPPPTLGVFMLWELSSNRFFPDPEGCAFEELGRALWIACNRRRAVPAVERFVYYDQAGPLDRGAQEVLSAGGEELIDNLPRLRSNLHRLPWNGLRMIPDSGDDLAPCPFLFDGEKIGLLASMAATLGIEWQAALWEIPVTLLGLMAAGEARRNRVDGVGRPADAADVKAKLAEARAKAEAAEAEAAPECPTCPTGPTGPTQAATAAPPAADAAERG